MLFPRDGDKHSLTYRLLTADPPFFLAKRLVTSCVRLAVLHEMRKLRAPCLNEKLNIY
jgi:hypothetical protein